MENLGTKLPNDPSLWDEIILNELGKKSPALASTVVATDMKESDYTSGNLTGLIIASDGKVLIPLVVRGFRIKPFDIFIYGDKVMALTEKTVSSTIFSPSVSSGKLVNTQDMQTSTDISRLVSPPDSLSGGFATPYSHYNKVACGKISVLDALKMAGGTTKDAFAAGLAKNKVLLEKVATLLPFQGIMAELQRGAKLGCKEAVERGGVFYIRDICGTYTVNGVAKMAEELGDLPEDVKSSLLLTGEALIAPEDSKTEITILTRKGIKPLKNTTEADVVCREGDTLSGMFLANVVTFDHNLTHKGLFLSKDGQWIYQEHLAGSFVDASPMSKPDMFRYWKENYGEGGDVPKIGEYGMFCINNKAIEPFRVVSLYNVSGSIIMSVAALSGQRLVVEYRMENAETIPNQQPLMVASGNLVSKYLPTDRVYIVSHPYRYVSLKAKRNGARTPEEALTASSGVEDGCVVTIKKTFGGYLVTRDFGGLAQERSGLLPSKLACQYELAQYGVGTKQAEMLINISPVSFLRLNGLNGEKRASVELPTRHSGAELPDAPPASYPHIFTNNPEQGQFIDQGTVNTAAMLDDPETLNLLLTIGMGEVDDKVRQYVVSNIGDIHDLIDKLGRLLLIVRTSENTGISESALSDLVQKLDRTAWELSYFSGRRQTAQKREGAFDE